MASVLLLSEVRTRCRWGKMIVVVVVVIVVVVVVVGGGVVVVECYCFLKIIIVGTVEPYLVRLALAPCRFSSKT